MIEDKQEVVSYTLLQLYYPIDRARPKSTLQKGCEVTAGLCYKIRGGTAST